MRQMIDYGRDTNGKLKFANGDFVREECTGKHQRALLLAGKGEYIASPLVGVGAVQYQDDENPENLMGEITRQFMQDGMEVNDLTMDPASIADSTVKPFVNAYYK